MSHDDSDRLIDELHQALTEVGVDPEQLRPRSGRELQIAIRDFSTFERDVYRREHAAAVEIMRRGHRTNQPDWCMGIQVTPTLRENAVLHARDTHMSLADALIEVCRVQADGLRLQAEMSRRRERMERNAPALRQQNDVHPVKRVLDTWLTVRGRVYTSPSIIEAAAVSRDVAAFVDVVADITQQYGNLSERPDRSELQFSLNFTPRMDTPHPAITINMMAPIEAKLVVWTEPDGTWNVRHNVVGASASRVTVTQSEETAPVIQDRGQLHDEEVGKQARSIQLDP